MLNSPVHQQRACHRHALFLPYACVLALFMSNMFSMDRTALLGVFLIWILSVNVAFADVRINEIAWMGTALSGANEWIELANEGDAVVDLSGWKIVAEDGSPSITLLGTIAPNGYFLIERTDDTTVLDIPADEIASFGKGLSNGGETLYLKNASDTTIDTVSGGVDWANIGGNNSTKETAQRTSLGWVTGTPTPRMQNVGGNDETSPVLTNTTSTNASSSAAGLLTAAPADLVSKAPPNSSLYPRKEISVSAGDDERAFVGFPVSFTAMAKGLYDESIPYASYRWNFGDGATGEGEKVSHAYYFPGEYIATLEVFWGTLRNTDRVSIRVTEPEIVIARTLFGKDGFVELVNHSSREIDLSLWQLQSGTGTVFVLPLHTAILAGKSLFLPNLTTGLFENEKDIKLLFPNGTAANAPASRTESISLGMKGLSKTATGAAIKEVVPAQESPARPLSVKNTLAANDAAKETAATILWQRGVATNSASIGDLASDFSRELQWFFGIAGLLLIILAGFIIARSNDAPVSVAGEYAIIEDIIESKDGFAKE